MVRQGIERHPGEAAAIFFASGQRLRTSHVLDCTARKNTADAMLIKRKARPAKYKISLPVFVNCYPLIGNPSIIIGPGNWSQGSAQLFSTLWKGLKFYTSGSNGFVCVNDVVRIMILLMNNEINGERFIVSSENVSYEQLFLWMAEGMEVASPK